MTKRMWVRDGNTQEVNRFEIRFGQYVSEPYGTELVHSSHNTKFGVLVELSRLKAAESRQPTWRRNLNVPSNIERSAVVERIINVNEYDRDDVWPAQVTVRNVWFTQRRNYGSVVLSYAQAGWSHWL